jgi:chromosome segregation protein
MADVLYGVTMQEQGVSRIVSVKFHKTQESTSEEPIQSLIPPAPVPSVEAEEDKMQSTKDTIEMVMAQ